MTYSPVVFYKVESDFNDDSVQAIFSRPHELQTFVTLKALK